MRFEQTLKEIKKQYGDMTDFENPTLYSMACRGSGSATRAASGAAASGRGWTRFHIDRGSKNPIIFPFSLNRT